MTRIRDPIHASIDLDARERAVIDSPFFQRLRHVRQMGFADLAFPGASHSRYTHALGACHVVSRVFEAVFARLPEVPATERARLKAAVRVAMLLHDLGHPPLSHASESILPPRAALGLPAWVRPGPGDERATHEDFTLKLLLDSELAELLRTLYGPDGLPPEAIASLLARVGAPDGWFAVGGIDFSPLLRQLVSSELDADRMDYLLRDSFFSGVNYGKFDLDWVIGHLGPHLHDGVAELSLGSRAIFAVEDFLLSRYHMFLSVYYHRTPICFDRMLRLYYEEAPGEYEIPAEPSRFLRVDDIGLWTAVRASENRWAQRLAQRQPFRLLLEANTYDTGYDLAGIASSLRGAEIPHFTTESTGMVSKYFGEAAAAEAIWVHVPDQRRFVPIEQYTPLFRRYQREVRIARIYVEPSRLPDARRLAGLPA